MGKVESQGLRQVSASLLYNLPPPVKNDDSKTESEAIRSSGLTGGGAGEQTLGHGWRRRSVSSVVW